MELVSNLILNSSQYTAGAQQAIGSNRAISGSIDSIIGQLQRQRTAFERSNLTTRDNILASAGKGATEGQVNVALQLNEEVDAQKRAKMAQDEATAAKLAAERASQSLIASLKAEQAVTGMTTAQIQIYRLAQAGASDADIRRASAIQRDIAASAAKRAADEAATAAAIRAKEAGESLVAALEREKAIYGMTAAQVRIYTAVQAGASAEDIRRATVLQSEIGAMQAAKEAQESLKQATNLSAASTGGFSRNSMVLTETIRGAEDAVSGFTNNGLKGMLQATTNNVNQIGSLIGGSAGLALSVGSIAGLIGVSLIPKLIEWANDTSKVVAEQERLARINQEMFDRELRSVSRMADQYKELNRMRADYAAGNEKLKSVDQIKQEDKAADREVAALEDEIRKQQEIKRTLLAENKNSNLKPVEFQAKPLRSFGQYAEESIFGVRFSDVETAEEAKQRKAENDKLNKMKDAYAEADRLEREAIEKSRLIGAQKQELYKQNADAEIRERNRQNQLLKANEREAQEEIDAQRREAEQKRLEAQRAFSSMLSSSVSQLDPKAGERRELEEKRRQIERAQKQGVISEAEAASLKSTIIAKPDPVSGSAAAVQAGTREAYSSIVRAMRGAEQAKEIERQRKLAESQLAVLERIETAIREQEELQVVETPI